MRAYFFLTAVCLVGVCVISWSKNLATINQGDSFHAFESLLDDKPLDVNPYGSFGKTAFVWSYSNSTTKPLHERDLSWIYLWAHARLQRLFSSHFDLFFMALISKIIVLACCCRLAFLCVNPATVRLWIVRLAVFILFACAFSLGHNIAFLNSFYGEHTFFVFLAVLLVGFLEPNRWSRFILVSTGSLFCSGAKPQYFCFGVFICSVAVFMALIERRRQDWLLSVTLICTSLVGWYFAFHAGVIRRIITTRLTSGRTCHCRTTNCDSLASKTQTWNV